ncbi:hypothetical protein BGZ47_008005 [Haplosporangium gracile]|nr:hypothetical protein BGZ47_008005 [Haplosporangium gracile]
MSLKGQYLEPLAPISPEFIQYQHHFGGNKLVKLYKIVYEPTGTHRLEQFSDYPLIFFHGTGHCGCLLKRGADTESTKINASDWCGMTYCATQGILNHGHLRAFSGKGQTTYLSMFLVKARYSYPQHTDICSVPNDMDILPCFLAVLRHP